MDPATLTLRDAIADQRVRRQRRIRPSAATGTPTAVASPRARRPARRGLRRSRSVAIFSTDPNASPTNQRVAVGGCSLLARANPSSRGLLAHRRIGDRSGCLFIRPQVVQCHYLPQAHLRRKTCAPCQPRVVALLSSASSSARGRKDLSDLPRAGRCDYCLSGWPSAWAELSLRAAGGGIRTE